ncbi:anti-phage-associated DUF1156 domain-containing protein [Sinorhizobium medicae]|uniref:anti-phage-associated DUF1156 domain-containing protein n=1 Tax=Sinorhizobium medicae TaxID=110321 RepID=UPI000FDBFA0E|nr:anti-phage-associated DUF1156 domain-containing protein [Sinorhizobium medicae]RVJ71439.1 DUF1156 domain-containing protein [Sinorhizobium medicae]
MNQHVKEVVPFSLQDAPSLIERIFPSMKLSAEAQKERKAGQGQTLTSLGSYWKGRKPLILVRACVLGCLLPATHDPEGDLAVFEILMALNEEALRYRVNRKSDLEEVARLPYSDRVPKIRRPEEISEDYLRGSWDRINRHLGTSADSLPLLVEQLGVMRFGRRPKVGDTFAGGGSIPFEAARVGCDVYASDLNPIACMLTWGALNYIGADPATRSKITEEQDTVAREVDAEITRLGIEHDEDGNRAKAFLYCLETTCIDTGWSVPLLPSRIISSKKRVIVDLIADEQNKRYDFAVKSGVSDAELKQAKIGTVVDGRVVHPANKNPDGVAITTIRGDYRDGSKQRGNKLRAWDKYDFVPREEDVFRERLYCIQWISKETIYSSRQETFFAAPSEADLKREAKVETIVRERLPQWQALGYVSDMRIEPGDKTNEPIRTRGWTHWHHLFGARHILTLALLKEQRRHPALILDQAQTLNVSSRGCMINSSAGQGGAIKYDHVFMNQALNTFLNYGVRGASSLIKSGSLTPPAITVPGKSRIVTAAAKDIAALCDIFITDPPYADAVHYHEITEYFIAWLRKNPPKEFADWSWDSRRRLAIKGKGEEFRANMVEAYKAMASHMPENGIQIVMFTHQDGKVWSDMAQIFWGAGLQVMADWYIATETTSELKKGGYVQGTHIIVLRKRSGNESGYSDEITQEVKEEVARQIEEMVGLNQSLKGKGRSENLFNDADLQMAGYAAALRVLTKYVKIDGKDMTIEAMRPRGKNERTVIDDIIEYAVQVANEHLVPEGMNEQTWRRLSGIERFYLKMMDIETTGVKKVDNYQNFAKAFRVADYGSLMSSVGANAAALKSAKDFGKRQMGDDEFGRSPTRAILYALWEMTNGVDDELVVGHVRDLVDNYLERRSDLVAIASYIQAKRQSMDRDESQNAGVLAGLIKNERLG